MNANPFEFNCCSTSFILFVFIFISCSTSVLPECEVILLFPCLITGTPALATTKATVVEILKLFD